MNTMNTMTAMQLVALATHAAKKDVRYYLNGIRVHKKHIVATDGHRIACYPHTFDLPAIDDDKGAYLMPHDVVKTIDKKQTSFRITPEGAFVCGHMTVQLEKTGGLDYLGVFGGKGVLPSYDYEGEIILLNAQYLMDAGKLAAQFSDNRLHSHRLKSGMIEGRTAEGSPAAVVLTRSPLFIGIMPFKASDQ